jgi:predicted phosphodiesterase
MKQYALISDIHGNITALKAVLQDIRRRGIDEIICLGDLVGKGPNSAEAVDMCRESCSVIIRGNWDDNIINEDIQLDEILWHRSQLGEKRLGFLKTLPFLYDFHIGKTPVRLFHASQLGNRYRVFMNDPYEKHIAMFESTEFTGNHFVPKAVGYGDIHSVFMKNMRGKLLFNVGSVGNPLDVNQSSYVILRENPSNNPQDLPDLCFVRVAYGIEEELRIAKRMEMPAFSEYQQELRTARYRGR